MNTYNFYAGPALLPKTVYEEASQAVLDYEGTGLSVLSISHRSNEFSDIIDEAKALTRELLAVPENYDVLFLHGGASSQFFMTAMNLLSQNETAGFVDTGNWSKKAIEEAQMLGDIKVIASSGDQNYTYIPKDYAIDESLKYLHITSNNTVRGTQFFDLPQTSVKVVADMSSDIFSRPVSIDRYGLIYAGAQKNLGPSGTTLVIVDKDWLGTSKPNLPNMLRYASHIDKGSLYNTPCTFSIYVSMLTLRWVKSQGGVSQLDQTNRQKASLLYDAIDQSALFDGTVKTEDRSLMNVNFVIKNKELETEFLKSCQDAGCIGVKGHRSVGGFRASIYNAMELSGVNTLIEVIKDFDKIKA